MTRLKYRSIFISDLHLGIRHCKVDYLLSFLQSTESEYLYLVGDIFDLWEMKKSVYRTQTQNEILQEVFRKAEHITADNRRFIDSHGAEFALLALRIHG